MIKIPAPIACKMANQFHRIAYLRDEKFFRVKDRRESVPLVCPVVTTTFP